MQISNLGIGVLLTVLNLAAVTAVAAADPGDQRPIESADVGSSLARSGTLPGHKNDPRTSQDPDPGTLIAPPGPITVKDSIETSRFLEASGEAFVVSPRGDRFATAIVTGDVARNGNWVTIFAGKLDTLDDAAKAQRVAKLFTRSTGAIDSLGSDKITLPNYNRLAWLSEEEVCFLWNDGAEQSRTQVVAVHVLSRKVRFITQHDTDVVDFAADPHGRLVFAASPAHSRAESQKMIQEGFAVAPDQYAEGLLLGEVDGHVPWTRYDHYLISTKPGSREEKVADHPLSRQWPQVMTFAPDGKHLLIDALPAAYPWNWDRYESSLYGGFFARELQATRKAPERASQITQFLVIDTASRHRRALWDIPNAPGIRAIWSPDSQSLLVGPTFLSADDASERGRKGLSVAIVDASTGRYSEIPLPQKADQIYRAKAWHGADLVALDGPEGPYFLRRSDANWVATAAPEQKTARVTLEVREGIETPPRLVAIDSLTSHERVVLDPNPRLAERRLGRVEMIDWTDSENRRWRGRLYYPANFKPGTPAATVIQTHGFSSPRRFSLYGFAGPGLGPSYSPFAAQALAGRNIAVLQIQTMPDMMGTTKEADVHLKGYESAITRLEALKVTDPARVGLAGYSRTGYHIEYILTHSDFPYGAAVVADNFDGSYLKAMLRGGNLDSYLEVHEVPPIGEGLQKWIAQAPGFNTDQVRVPLQMQTHSAGLPSVLQQWEMLAALRFQNKPVELYVVPDIEHGTHALQNPKQVQAAQERAVDWFDFWLNNHQDSDPRKQAQYAQWHVLREQYRRENQRMSMGQK